MSNEIKSFPDMRAKLRERLSSLAEEYPSADAPAGDLRDADYGLVRAGTISEQQLTEIYSECYDIPAPDENDLRMPDPYPNAPQEFLNANLCVPYEWSDENKTMVFLVADPYSIEHITFLVNKSWHFVVSFQFVRRTFLERMLSRLQNIDEEEQFHESDDEASLRSMAGEAKIVRLVNDIFTRALEDGASDIHVEPGEDAVVVRCRIDGVLREIMSCPLNQFPAIASRIKLIGGLNIAESRLPQDGRTNVKLGHEELDMRISTLPILTGESIVLRLLNQDALTFDLKTLGMSDANLRDFEKLISIPYGIILVVGPTGSGKTTTLYSVINQLNDNKKKIITIEDPVEYKTAGLCQMQVNEKIGVTFGAGLRSIVRQDPDIILVGEIRDRETADIAINAALTGHLVLSTLHTNDAVGAVTRLLDMGVEPFLVSSALYGVLSQRLVRKICTVCGGSGYIGVPMGQKGDVTNRCKRCGGTGFKGRSGVFELLTVTDDLRAAVIREEDSSVLQAIAVKHGMRTLRQDADEKVRLGITTREEANRSVADM